MKIVKWFYFDLSCKNFFHARINNNIFPDIGLEADALSISQQKCISSLLEMILALGVLPNLLQGVGTPLHKRSQFLQLLLRVGFIQWLNFKKFLFVCLTRLGRVRAGGPGLGNDCLLYNLFHERPKISCFVYFTFLKIIYFFIVMKKCCRSVPSLFKLCKFLST